MNSSDAEMGTKDSADSISAFSVEALTVNKKGQEDHTRTAHRINHDPWYQLGVLLAVSFNCGYILGFSNLIMRPLGWIWGTVSMAVLAVLSVYVNCLIAKLHIIDGRRFIRYRDLMGFVLGRKMYYVTWILQFTTFILGNVGFLLLSGRALKATLKQPVIKNMHKALYFQFSVGLSFYYSVTIIGYWAYGSSVSEYLLNDVTGPKWEKILANATMFIQTIISQHMFCAAIHETLDTRFSHLHEKDFSPYNILIRFILRSLFFTMNSFIAAMLPFLGDFVNLSGSICVIPLTFIFPSLI